MEPNFSIRLYEEGDEDGIIELFDRVFKGWPKIDLKVSKRDHWMWKYLGNPVGKSIIHVAVKDGKIIGSNNTIPRMTKFGGSQVLTAIGTDLSVDAEYRHMGIRNSLREKSFELKTLRGIYFVTLITGNQILIESYQREKLPRFPHPIVALARIHDIDLHLKAMPVDDPWIKKAGFQTLKVVNRFGRSLQYRAAGEVKVRDISSFDTRIDAFWNDVSPYYDFIDVRNMSYLNWRHSDPRSGGFIIKQAEEGDRVLGYIVLRINRYIKEYPIGYIVDLLAHPKRPDAADALIGAAVDYFDSDNVNTVNTIVVKGNSLENAFSRFGFLDSRIRLQVFFRPHFSDVVEKLPSFSAQRSHFSWGDHDSLPLSTSRDI